MTDRIQRILLYVIAALFCVALVSYCVTLPFGAVTWYDNVVINEMARGGITHKALDWSVVVTGHAELDSQSWATYYIGGLLTEFAYQCCGWLGPKILLLIVYLLTSGFVYFYSKRTSGSTFFAALLALCFFVFPRVASGVKSGRVDMLALGFVFAALALMAWARDTRFRCTTLFLVGVLGACSVFTWMTAIIAFPALMWEVVRTVESTKPCGRMRFTRYGLAAMGFILAVIVLAAPFLLDLQTTVEGLKANLAYNLQNSNGSKMLQVGVYIKTLVALPGFFALGAIAIFSRKRFWILALGFIVFSAFTMFTKAGTARMIYFLPSMVIALAILAEDLKNTRRGCLLACALGCVLVLSFVRTVGLRTVEDFRYKNKRDVVALQREFESIIGRGASVYTDTFQPYYIGRALNWRQYRVGSVKGLDPMPYLARCDWYVRGWCELDGVTEDQLKEAGYRFERTIALGEVVETTSSLKYGPYRLYRKVN